MQQSKSAIAKKKERDFTIGKEYMEIYKSVLDTSGMSSQTRKMFENIKYGVAQCF